jgi:hypothetical protein
MRSAYEGLQTAYEIKDGKIFTSLGNSPFEVTVYKLGERYYGARSNEFGYANYEVIPVPQQLGTEVEFKFK